MISARIPSFRFLGSSSRFKNSWGLRFAIASNQTNRISVRGTIAHDPHVFLHVRIANNTSTISWDDWTSGSIDAVHLMTSETCVPYDPWVQQPIGHHWWWNCSSPPFGTLAATEFLVHSRISLSIHFVRPTAVHQELSRWPRHDCSLSHLTFQSSWSTLIAISSIQTWKLMTIPSCFLMMKVHRCCHLSSHDRTSTSTSTFTSRWRKQWRVLLFFSYSPLSTNHSICRLMQVRLDVELF